MSEGVGGEGGRRCGKGGGVEEEDRKWYKIVYIIFSLVSRADLTRTQSVSGHSLLYILFPT